MEKRVAKLCCYCGGAAILKDAWAEWDVGQQQWILHEPLQQVFCKTCDGETRLVEVELAPTA